MRHVKKSELAIENIGAIEHSEHREEGYRAVRPRAGMLSLRPVPSGSAGHVQAVVMQTFPMFSSHVLQYTRV